jgi:transposase
VVLGPLPPLLPCDFRCLGPLPHLPPRELLALGISPNSYHLVISACLGPLPHPPPRELRVLRTSPTATASWSPSGSAEGKKSFLPAGALLMRIRVFCSSLFKTWVLEFWSEALSSCDVRCCCCGGMFLTMRESAIAHCSEDEQPFSTAAEQYRMARDTAPAAEEPAVCPCAPSPPFPTAASGGGLSLCAHRNLSKQRHRWPAVAAAVTFLFFFIVSSSTALSQYFVWLMSFAFFVDLPSCIFRVVVVSFLKGSQRCLD